MIRLSRVMPAALKLTCIAIAAAGSVMMRCGERSRRTRPRKTQRLYRLPLHGRKIVARLQGGAQT